MPKTFRLGVSWRETGTLCIPADTEQEAIDKANDQKTGLPEGQYLEGSFRVDSVDNGDDRYLDEKYVLKILQQYIRMDKTIAGQTNVLGKLHAIGVSDRDMELLGIGDLLTNKGGSQ